MKQLTIYFVVLICLSTFITVLAVAANVAVLSIFFAVLTVLLCALLYLSLEIHSTLSIVEQQESAEECDTIEYQFFNSNSTN